MSGEVYKKMIDTATEKKIEEIVRDAGKTLLSAHLETGEVHQKDGPANFVTDYDVKIQARLIRELSRVLPGCSFFGEEDTAGNEHRVGEGYTFFIDPIDGTTNFMFDYKNSCVSVGRSENGSMIAGWVYNPYTGQFWSAVRGSGATLNGRRISVNPGGLEDGIFSILPKLFGRSLSVRCGGSAAIDLSRIASGSNAAYVEMLIQPYDYAAGSVIIEEAGGVIGQMDGSPITLDRGCSIVAGTPKAVAEILEIIKAER